MAEEAARQLAAAFLVAALLQQQGTEPLLRVIDGLQCRFLPQISGQALVLHGCQVLPMTTQQGEQATVLRSDGIDFPPAAEEVVVQVRMT